MWKELCNSRACGNICLMGIFDEMKCAGESFPHVLLLINPRWPQSQFITVGFNWVFSYCCSDPQLSSVLCSVLQLHLVVHLRQHHCRSHSRVDARMFSKGLMLQRLQMWVLHRLHYSTVNRLTLNDLLLFSSSGWGLTSSREREVWRSQLQQCYYVLPFFCVLSQQQCVLAA